ncbi:MAG: hypothetical protein HY735_05210 [Verrucomicrobia bacterium]|nr:hypothetical protein [Verrucomicrobiota bacterium]
MSVQVTRRNFLKASVAGSTAAGMAMSFEEQALLAYQSQPPDQSVAAKARQPLPTGKLGKVSVSRLICGGNLISGFAHSRDLIYVSPLMMRYFTDAKVFETLQLCEANGINTTILRLDENTLRLLKAYWKDHDGKIQWIAQISITENEMAAQIRQAADNGAVGAFTHGGVGDDLFKKGKIDVLGKAVELIKKQGLAAGIAGHALEVPKACEKAGIKPDFYMKTFNSKRYWSAGLAPRNDSVWEETPQETMAFMEEVEVPWIAYKVLGAGAIHPREGFQYAFQNGADFLCAGMFDFQVAEDAEFARSALEKNRLRNRPWSV